MKKIFLTLMVLVGIAFPWACSKNNNPVSPALTATPVPTATTWANYTPTITPTPTGGTATSTPTNFNGYTSTITFTPTVTYTLTSTSTLVPNATNTFTCTPTSTCTSTATPTDTVTATFTNTPYNYPNNSPTPSYITSGPSVIQYPNGLAVNSAGTTVYVAESTGDPNSPSNSIQILNSSLSPVGSITGFGTTAFGSPNGVAVNPINGNIFVVDSVSNAVYEFTSAGVTVLSWSSWSGGMVTSFNQPEGIAVDSTGNIYVADSYNSTVEEFTAGNAVTYGNQWNLGVSSIPSAIAVDGSGNLFVADAGQTLVQYYNGSAWTSWPTVSGSDLFGIAVDSSDNVYTADAGNGLMEEYTKSGSLETAWDGPNNDFIDPDGVVILPGSGNILVADYTGPNGTGSLQEFGP